MICVSGRSVLDTSLQGNLSAFKATLLFAVGFLIVIGLLSYIYGRINNRLKNYMIRDYRHMVYSGLMKMNYQTFNSTNSAEYLSALTNDINFPEDSAKGSQ